jgi:hypothetical protein
VDDIFGGMGQAGGEKSSQYLANLCDRFPLQKKKNLLHGAGVKGLLSSRIFLL